MCRPFPQERFSHLLASQSGSVTSMQLKPSGVELEEGSGLKSWKQTFAGGK